MQVYGVIGIFGAARYGDRTQGNILVNSWLGGPAEGGPGPSHSSLPVDQHPRPMQVGLVSTVAKLHKPDIP